MERSSLPSCFQVTSTVKVTATDVRTVSVSSRISLQKILVAELNTGDCPDCPDWDQTGAKLDL